METEINMKWRIIVMILGLLVAGAATPSFAAKPDKPDAKEGKEAKGDENRKQELQPRFAKRLARLNELKKQGVIGETYEGYLDFVKGKKDGADVVDEENTDRRELYKLIADKEGTTPDKVGERNAKRNFSKASAGEYLKDASGEW